MINEYVDISTISLSLRLINYIVYIGVIQQNKQNYLILPIRVI